MVYSYFFPNQKSSSVDDFLFSSLDVGSHLNVLLLESCHVILKDCNVVANVTMGPRLNYYKKL